MLCRITTAKITGVVIERSFAELQEIRGSEEAKIILSGAIDFVNSVLGDKGDKEDYSFKHNPKGSEDSYYEANYLDSSEHKRR